MNFLVVDVGGTHVKILATGQTQHRKFASGQKLTAAQMVAGVEELGKEPQVVRIGMTFMGISVFAQQIVFGFILVAAVAITMDRSKVLVIK